MKWKIAVLLVVCLPLYALTSFNSVVPLYADSGPVAVVPASSVQFEDPLSLPRIFRTIVSIALVSALAVLVLRQVAKYREFREGDRNVAGRGGKRFVIEERIALDGKNQVVVLRRGVRRLVLGVGDKGITLLGLLDEREDFVPANETVREGERAGVENELGASFEELRGSSAGKAVNKH